MRRTLTAIAVCLSAVLLGITLADWLHSIDNSETYILSRTPTLYAIDNVRGEISFWRGELLPHAQLPAGWYHEHYEAPHYTTAKQFTVVNPAGEELWLLGFAITNQRRFPSTVRTVMHADITNVAGFVIPLWFPTAVLTILMLAGTRQLLRQAARVSRGLCQSCGYDLRASRHRCPECGTAIPAN